MPEPRYPGYDVLAKRNTPSWNEQTRRVDRPAPRRAARAALLHRGGIRHGRGDRRAHRSLPAGPAGRSRSRRSWTHKLHERAHRTAIATPGMPRDGDAWRQGLRALDAEARHAHGTPLPRSSSGAEQDALLTRMQRGRAARPVLGRHAAQELLHEAHGARHRPCAFLLARCVERDRVRRPGQPARLCPHASSTSATPGKPPRPRTAMSPPRAGRTAMSDDPAAHAARAAMAARPDVFRPGAWVPMREYRRGRRSRFRHRRHRRGRRHARLQAGRSRLLRRRAWTPAPIGARSRISRPTRSEQSKLYWTDDRIVDGDNPLAARQQQFRQGGRRQHRAFRHGVAALPPGMVQGAHEARLRRGLAARLARDVALLRRGRGRAEDRRARSPIPGARSGRAIPIARMS